MKTIVNIITGRKDFPIFNTDSNEKILEWVGIDLDEDAVLSGNIIKINRQETYEIINVKIINL